MPDITIDETTGLPELPGKQYWELEYQSGMCGMMFEPITSAGYHLCIKMDVTTRVWSDWEPGPNIPADTPAVDGVQTRPKKLDTRHWYGPRKTATEYRFEYEEESPITLYSRRVEPFEGFTHIDEWDVREVAETLIEDIRKQDAVDSLVGCYPPNKLEVN